MSLKAACVDMSCTATSFAWHISLLTCLDSACHTSLELHRQQRTHTGAETTALQQICVELQAENSTQYQALQ